MVKKVYVSFLFFFTFSTALFSQSAGYWETVYQQISYKQSLAELSKQLDSLRQTEAVQNNPAALARVYHYRVLIGDAKTEDTLFFRQSAAFDSLLHSNASPQLKTIVHLMQAERLVLFSSRFSYRGNKILFKNPGGPAYNLMSQAALDSTISYHFSEAKKGAAAVDTLPVVELLWLASDPDLFLFKPVFGDIVAAEQLHSAQRGENKFSLPLAAKASLLLPPDAFLQFADTTAMLAAAVQKVLHQYVDWANEHGKKDPAAYYFIETLARKYLYNSTYADSTTERNYETYLKSLLQSPYTTVKAYTVYQLCLLWNKQAAGYNRQYDDFNSYYPGLPARFPFDSTYRLQYVKAHNLYEANIHLLDSFPFMRNILLVMKEKMLQPQLQLSAEDDHLPGSPIAMSLLFRNVKTVYVRLVQVNAAPDISSLFDKQRLLYLLKNSDVKTISPVAVDSQIVALLANAVVKDTTCQLPDTEDYQHHQCFLKMGGLPPGHYVLLYSDSAIGTTAGKISFLSLNSTEIAVINNDSKVFVLSRKTGFPLTGASVVGNYKKWVGEDGKRTEQLFTTEARKVNAQGFVEIPEKKVQQLQVRYGKDTIYASMNEANNNTPEELYDKEQYDDLMEYYTDQVRLHLFTDRSIYRPGQTVFYKGIFIIRNPKTGEPLVLNWKNLQFPFFKKLMYKLVVKFSRKRIQLFVEDAFGRNVDTLNVIPNEYGSVAGFFTIPKNAATGDWDLDTDDIEIDDYNKGEFKVEEYKRPLYEVSIEKPKKELQMGDSFQVKVKVKSFAGATLNHVLIRYTIERSAYVPDGHTSKYITQKLEDDEAEQEGYTDEKGELNIAVDDSLLKRYQFPNEQRWSASYTITAEAIDPTGESHESTLNLQLTNRPYRIDATIPKTIDRNELNPVFISVNSELTGPVQKPVTIRIYRTGPTAGLPRQTVWPRPDVWLYLQPEFETAFPETADKTVPEKKQDTLIYETTMQAGGEQKFSFPAALLTAGNYRLYIVSKENGNITGEATKLFAVFDKAANQLPEATTTFEYLPSKTIDKGKTIRWVTGNSIQDIFSVYQVSYFARGKKGMGIQYRYDIKPEKKGVNEWSFTLPVEAYKQVAITHLYIISNHLYTQRQTISITESDENNPQIFIEKYRRVLMPGSSSQFAISIKTKNENTAAELMTTLYDASLDKIEKHEWRLPYLHERNTWISSGWNSSITALQTNRLYNYDFSYAYTAPDYTTTTQSLWWLNPLDYSTEQPLYNYWNNKPSYRMDSSRVSRIDNQLSGKVSGISIANTDGYDEVVVIGYGAAIKRDMTGSVSNVVVRGTSSLSAYSKSLIIIDGVMYDGDISKINGLKFTDAMMLKDATATALYGSRGANGVILISTKGPVMVPELPQEPPMVIRKNFNETAFFFPQVHADRNGNYTFDFTMPESVTEWKWKMLAHTKDARFAYLEKSILTQLPLMIQPHLPRYLYEGDKLLLSSRISNLDTIAISGTATILAEDAITGENVTGLLIQQTSVPFSIAAKTNTSVGFSLQVPPVFLHPLKIKVLAKTPAYADGEEHILPILNRKALVSKTVPLSIHQQKEISFITPALPADAEPYGLGLYTSPKPQTALLNSLAYLVSYPYGCAEQTFNKMIAHCIATQLMRTDTSLQKSYRKLPEPDDTAANALPDELAEQTMPWLQLNHAHLRQQQQLKKLLDTLKGNEKITQYFTQLKDLQNTDGGIAWFKDGKSDRYISLYLLGGFGKMAKEQLPFMPAKTDKTSYQDFINKLLAYCDQQLLKPDIYPISLIDTIHYLYARSYFATADSLKEKWEPFLNAAFKNNNRYSLHQQASLITVALRFGSSSISSAKAQLENIRQLAISDTLNGVRWKTISNADDLNTSTEEAVADIAAAFEESGTDTTILSGIIKWLLTTRETHRWNSTKSAAAVVALLQRHSNQNINAGSGLTAFADKTTLSTRNDLLTGKLFDFAQSAQFPATTQVQPLNATVPANGGLSYYYFTAMPPGNEENNITISKAYFVYQKASDTWQAIHDSSIVKTGDKVKAIITIITQKPLEYVLIDDKNAAALEASDPISGYEYNNGFSYYQSVRDVGHQFFAATIPSGKSAIEYETIVSHQGNFRSGITALQCMYRPEVRAYISSFTMVVQ